MRRDQEPQKISKQQYLRQVSLDLKEASLLAVLDRPAIPNVIFQPDLLIVPRAGMTVAVFVEDVRLRSITWGKAFEMLEKLFELKVIAGAHITAVLALLGEEGDTKIEQLLTRMFDHFVQEEMPGFLHQDNPDSLWRDHRWHLSAMIMDYLHPKERWKEFWHLEKEARRKNYEQYIEKPHIQKMLRGAASDREEHDLLYPDITRGMQFEKLVYERLTSFSSSDYSIYIAPRVENVKSFLGGYSRAFYFEFDFLVLPHLWRSNWHSGHYNPWLSKSDLVEFFQRGGAICELSYLSRRMPIAILLRKLAIRARFISYLVEDQDAEMPTLHALPGPQNLFFIVNDYIRGPRHAPTRYVEMLVGAGWQPILFSDLSPDVFKA